MSKAREVYAEKVNNDWINPFVDFRLPLSEVNKVKDLISKSEPQLLIPTREFGKYTGFECPVCGTAFGEHAPRTYKYCYECGQKFSETEVDFG